MTLPVTSSDRRKLKICVIGSTFPRHEGDHEVPWLRKSVNLITERGHDVTVAVPSFEGLRSHRIDGVRVLRFRYAPRRFENLTHDQGAPNKLHNPLYNLLALPYIVMGIINLAIWSARERFDVIHVHWPFPHGLFAVIPALMGVKVVSTCHGAELALGRKKKWIRSVLSWLLRKSDVVGCNSSHTAGEIKAVSARAATIIPYGATTRIEPAGTKLEKSPGEPATILFSGRLIQRKGLPYLIRTIPELLKHRPVKLVITGNGDRREELEKLTRELGLESSVTFRGFVSNEELGELYRTCDLYVHPAIFDDKGDTEGLGVVLIEALMNERPVVASAVGGIVDVIEHEETGLLVPEKDEPALAAAILRLLGDPELAERLGKAGSRFAERHFDWSRITDETEELYYRAMRDACAVPVPELKGAACAV
jgi:glycosyltransferase involved in cell wall biosynthesis